MELQEIYTRITTIMRVLNNVEVKGVQNMDNLGGCVHILEDMAKKISASFNEQE